MGLLVRFWLHICMDIIITKTTVHYVSVSDTGLIVSPMCLLTCCGSQQINVHIKTRMVNMTVSDMQFV